MYCNLDLPGATWFRRGGANRDQGLSAVKRCRGCYACAKGGEGEVTELVNRLMLERRFRPFFSFEIAFEPTEGFGREYQQLEAPELALIADR